MEDYTLADFDIQRVLGQGSFGLAYLVTRKSDKMNLVIKQILASESELSEAKMLAELDHPNIIKYYGSFFENDCAYLVLEFANRQDLAYLIDEQTKKKMPILEKSILTIFLQLCASIQYIHGKRIIHRDLKTGNVFLNYPLHVKLGDFGISKKLQSTNDFATTTVGSPYYMAPEFFENCNYNNKVDIWSLGCILYELCMLKRPFEANNILALTLKILSAKYPPLPSSVHPDFVFLIRSMLQLDPQKRPSINTIISNPFIKNAIDKFDIIYDNNIESIPSISGEDDLALSIENNNIMMNNITLNTNGITNRYSRNKITNQDVQRDIQSFADKRGNPKVREQIKKEREDKIAKKERNREEAEMKQRQKEHERSEFLRRHEESKKKEQEEKESRQREYKNKINNVSSKLNIKELRKKGSTGSSSKWDIDIVTKPLNPLPQSSAESTPIDVSEKVITPVTIERKPSSSRELPNINMKPPTPQLKPKLGLNDTPSLSDVEKSNQKQSYIEQNKSQVQIAVGRLSCIEPSKDEDASEDYRQHLDKQRDLCINHFGQQKFVTILEYIHYTKSNDLDIDVNTLSNMMNPNVIKGWEHLRNYMYYEDLCT